MPAEEKHMSAIDALLEEPGAAVTYKFLARHLDVSANLAANASSSNDALLPPCRKGTTSAARSTRRTHSTASRVKASGGR